MPLDRTYASKTDCERALRRKEAEIANGEWISRDLASTTFADYAITWVENSARLRPNTRRTYHSEIKHLTRAFGPARLGDISTAHVRHWHAEHRRHSGLAPATVAKHYKRLRSILGTAVEDGLISKNPAFVRGAGQEPISEMHLPTREEVARLTAAAPARTAGMVHVAAWCGLRFGECSGLVRSNLNLDKSELSVELQGQDFPAAEGGWKRVPPKTPAAVRTLAIPPSLVPLLHRHLEAFVEDDRSALVFTGPRGGPMRRSNFTSTWNAMRASAGVSDSCRFHDLRHFHGTLLAQNGASAKEIMARQGQTSLAAAMRYIHATQERDRDLAQKLDAAIPLA